MSIVNKHSNQQQQQQQQYAMQEEEEPMPFEGLEKSTVLQECKVHFNAVTVSVSKCMRCMNNVLYLLGSGYTLTTSEATDVFFAATKLFQCENAKIRRLLFVFLKELSGSAEQVFIASSSLVKDMSGTSDVLKANAIRTLRKVGDASVIAPMERHIKQALLDKNQNVTCAAITAGIALAQQQPEMVKRWSPEVSEVLKTKGNKVQYHALALLHKLRKSDRVSVLRLISQAQNGPLRSPLALCLLIRLCTELMHEDFSQSIELFKFVNSQTHHHSDMVVFEACKSICSLRCLTVKEIAPVCVVLQLYLNSHRSVMRFAAVRLLSRVATGHPQALSASISELDTLISDPNRHIATLAVATILKAGDEGNVEKILLRIGSFMKELNDDFKTVVVEAIKIIVVKFPSKFQAVLDFFAKPLANEGSSTLKSAIVDTIITMAKTNETAKVECLSTLADFIDDCEYNALAIRILHFFGEEVHTTPHPQRFIRSVYNRISLESPVVRACAVTTLAKVGARCPDLRQRVVPLLTRCTADVDDEVRDRSVLFSKILASGDEYIVRSLILDVEEAVHKERKHAEARVAADIAKHGGSTGVEGGASESELSEIRAQQQAKKTASALAASKLVSSAASAAAGGGGGGADDDSSAESYSPSVEVLGMCDAMRKIQQIKDFGEPMYSTEPTLLTEADSEYVVACVKHTYATHLVLQFKVTNTMDDQIMVGAVPEADIDEVDLEAKFAVACNDLSGGSSTFCYLAFDKEEGAMPLGPVHLAFKFGIKEAGQAECDPPEEFPLEDLELNVCDYIQPQVFSNTAAFERQWKSMRNAGQEEGEEPAEGEDNNEGTVSNTYTLPSKNLTSAMNTILDFYKMALAGPKPERINTKSHTLLLSGLIMLNEPVLVLAKAKVFVTTTSEVALQISMKGGSEELMEFLISSLVE